MLKRTLLALIVAAAVSTPAAAQGRSLKPRNDGIPAAYRPPAGMCRIWLDGVPPAQQPAPTDCANAVRNRPANGRVIFGDDFALRPDRKREKPDDRKEDRKDDKKKPRDSREHR